MNLCVGGFPHIVLRENYAFLVALREIYAFLAGVINDEKAMIG